MRSLAPEPVDRAVLDAVRAPFAAYAGRTGAAWTDAPTLQPLSLLLDLSGEAMRPRLFAVQAEGGEELALRADFTVSLARAFVQSGETEGRWLYEGQAYRVAPAGSGRPSEFLQLGLEVFGAAADPATEDAEVAALAWAAAAAGGREDLSLLMGDVALFAAFLRALDLPDPVRARLHGAFAGGRSVRAELERASVGAPTSNTGRGRLARLLAGLPEGEAAEVLEEVWRVAGIQPVGGRDAGEIVHRLVARDAAAHGFRLTTAERATVESYLALAGEPIATLGRVEDLARASGAALDPWLESWSRRLSALEAAGVPRARMRLDGGFTRPFGYYDGLLFEVRSAALPQDAPVAAGGRSDGLAARLGGGATPSVGCAVRPGRAGV